MLIASRLKSIIASCKGKALYCVKILKVNLFRLLLDNSKALTFELSKLKKFTYNTF